MLRHKPTQIRPTIHEYLSPSRRREVFTSGYAYETHWTRDMLLRLKELGHTGLSDKDVLAALQKEFGKPHAVEEIWQERVLLVIGEEGNYIAATSYLSRRSAVLNLSVGPRTDGTWNTPMEEKVIEMVKSGKNATEITAELFRVYHRPRSWTETYRKMQELKLNGLVE
ncbi:MAG: hypothetical protein L6R40_006407 [Gallowayella cf. fulva]|nr:MAG: hypothetical protein L6R40_006407 [Xanthomendoza cf. fulva]